MNSSRLALTVVIFLLCWSHVAIASAQQMTVDELLQEYSTASARLRNQYQQSIIMEYKWEVTGNDDHFQYVYFGDGNRERLDRKDFEGNQATRLRVGDVQYRVSRHKSERDYRVQIVTDRDTFDEAGNLQLNEPMPFAAFSVFETSAVDFLQRPDLHIKSISTDFIDGRELITVSWKRTVKAELGEQNARKLTGKLVFDRSRQWLLASLMIKYSEDAKGELVTEMSYELGPNDHWHLSAVHNFDQDVLTKERTLLSKATVVLYRRENIPHETFSLETFPHQGIEIPRN